MEVPTIYQADFSGLCGYTPKNMALYGTAGFSERLFSLVLSREWGHGMIVYTCCGSFPHSLLGTSKFLVGGDLGVSLAMGVRLVIHL